MKKTVIFLGLLSLSQLITNCSNNETETIDPKEILYTEVLTNVSVDVITKTYQDLYTNSTILKSACENFIIGDENKLQAIKDAWMATRAPWEKTEGFLYGPVDTEGIDPAIDSWPVDVNAIDNILSSSQQINSSLLETNNEARGFHTIEYFVWGLNGTKAASDLTAREVEYLTAAAQNLSEKTAQLYNGWAINQGNYARNFYNAGQIGSIYTSKKSALQELVEGVVIIADEVANGKIEEPLNGNNGGAKPEAEESRFSNNSKLDFANNIKSIQNIYLGSYNGHEGKGLSHIVALTNPILDSTLKSKITDAISAIEAIPGTFTNAIVNNRVAVQNAQTKVAELKITLENQLVPLISNL